MVLFSLFPQLFFFYVGLSFVARGLLGLQLKILVKCAPNSAFRTCAFHPTPPPHSFSPCPISFQGLFFRLVRLSFRLV